MWIVGYFIALLVGAIAGFVLCWIYKAPALKELDELKAKAKAVVGRI